MTTVKQPLRDYSKSLGWRKDPLDHRDYYRLAAPSVLKTLPKKVLVPTSKVLPKKYDQGALSSCGPTTAARLCLYRDAVMKGGRDKRVTLPARLYIYWTTRYLMGTVWQDSGVENRQMLKAMAKWGYCAEAKFPYNPAAYQQRPSNALFAEGRLEMPEYYKVVQAVDQMKASLAAGNPFVFGFSVFPSMLTAAVERTGIVPMPGSHERPEGGHDVLIVGYDDATRRFRFDNSWSNAWGMDGSGEIPYDYAADPDLASDFWTVASVA